MSYTLVSTKGFREPVVECTYGGLNGAKQMFFRPSFCANCGVKIERAEWRLWTSRRFCEVCAVELKEHEILPKAIGIILSLITIVAVGIAFSTRSRSSELQALKQETKKDTVVEKRKEGFEPVGQSIAAPTKEIQPEIRNLASTTEQQIAAIKKPKVVIEESPIFCGAETKKGTPCSRRVKEATRCYQHQGMPSMTVAETKDRKGQR